jgi:hypothetical protein
VSDSEDNTPVKNAKVGTDSLNYVLTDSTGAFSFNTAGNVGISYSPAHQKQLVSWDPMQGAFRWTGNSGNVSIQVTNVKGSAVAQFSSDMRSTDTKLSLNTLPQGVYVAKVTLNGQTSVYRIVNVRGSMSATMQSADISGTGVNRLGAVQATTVLTITKGTFLSLTRTFTGSQSNVSIKLHEDHGLTRHPFLYAGEYQGKLMANQKMYIVRGGKITWTFNLVTGSSELDDVWLMSDGNLAYSRKLGASGMVMATQASVWSFANTSVDLHTCQPLSKTRFLLMANGNPAQALIYNTVTKTVEKTMTLPVNTPTNSHGQFRLIRMTKAGTLLVAHMDLGKVVEYDTAGATPKPIWTYASGGSPWAAVRLKNGNTLVSGNGTGWVREVNPKDSVVWQINKTDLPGITLQTVQQCNRLDNGNTVICSWNGGALGTADIAVVEVTPSKRVVWQFPTSVLGPATSIQLLDEPGVPENVGDLQR